MKEKAVCYVGGISRIRGVIEMVEAIGKTKYKLIQAGNFEPGLEQKLMKMPGWSQVESLGFVDRTGVREVMTRSIAGWLAVERFLLFLRFETFGPKRLLIWADYAQQTP